MTDLEIQADDYRELQLLLRKINLHNRILKNEQDKKEREDLDKESERSITIRL